MCGRFTLTSTPESLAERFGLSDVPRVAPRYNVAPGQDVLAVRVDEAGTRRADALRWGLVPAWADSPAVGARMINARAETAATRPAFRESFRARRCLVPADGFYEWSPRGASRHPYWIGLPDRAPFAFAGLWERWRERAGGVIETCAILTTEANERLAELHPRMPVILARDAECTWMDPAVACEELSALLRPLPDDALAFHPVGTRVNRVECDDPGLLERVPEPPSQPSLF
jgi:putative SOS response-associated peptidase YedK